MNESYETVRLKRSPGLATIVLNRPQQRNSISSRMMEELYEITQKVASDPDIRVTVLKGEGKDFCPGADVKHYGSVDSGGRSTGWSDLATFRIPVLLHEMPSVTIAAIRGACAGAGMMWAAACDFRIASASAKFNSAFLGVGVAGDMGGPWSLPHILGAAKARELCFLPEKFDAEEALRIGLVSKVSLDDTFDDMLDGFVGRLNQAAPLALKVLKSNFLAAEKMGFGEYVALEAERHVRLFQSEDTTEAFRAYVEKRQPAFKGR